MDDKMTDEERKEKINKYNEDIDDICGALASINELKKCLDKIGFDCSDICELEDDLEDYKEAIKRAKKEIVNPPKYILSPNEYNLLTLLDGRFNYITRDKEGDLWCFIDKPKRSNHMECWISGRKEGELDDGTWLSGIFGEDIFSFITWNDAPIKIKDIIISCIIKDCSEGD